MRDTRVRKPVNYTKDISMKISAKSKFNDPVFVIAPVLISCGKGETISIKNNGSSDIEDVKIKY